MDAEQYKEAGNQAFKDKNYDEAIKNFTNAVNAGGSNTHIYYSNMSAAYYAKGMYAEASESAHKSIEAKPDFVKAYIRLLNAECYNNSPEIIIKSIHAAYSVSPTPELQTAIDNTISTIYVRFTIFGSLDTNMCISAISQLGGATNLCQNDPNFTPFKESCKSDPSRALELLSDAQTKAKEMLEQMAKEHAQPEEKKTATTEQPKEEPVPEEKPQEVAQEDSEYAKLKMEADTLFKQKKYVEAIESYKVMSETNEKDPVPLNNIAACLINLKRHEEAISYTDKCVAVAKKVFNIDQVVKALGRKGTCYIALGQLEEARDALKAAQLEKKTRENAIKLKEVQVELAKQNKESYYSDELGDKAKADGDAAFRSSEYNSALSFYADALKRYRTTNPNYVKVLSNRAQAYTRIFQLEAACDDYTSVLAIDPLNWVTYIRRAEVYRLRSILHKAKIDLDRVINECPDSDIVNRAKAANNTLSATLVQKRQQIDPEAAQKTVNEFPELGVMLKNPAVEEAIKNISQNPSLLDKYLRDPEIGSMLQILLHACVI